MTKVFLAETISIPYGAIKRVEGVASRGDKKQFQFLMVRLKACTYANSLSDNTISIPYGAIKSHTCI